MAIRGDRDIADRQDALDFRWAFEESFGDISHNSDGEANAPEQRSDHYADDRVFPNQTDEGGYGVEDHEGEDEQWDTPQDAIVPDAELNTGIVIESYDQERHVHGYEDTAADVFA